MPPSDIEPPFVCAGSGRPTVMHQCPVCGRRYFRLDTPVHDDERSTIRSDTAKVNRALAVVRASEKRLGDDTAPPRRRGRGLFGSSTKGLG
jgi:hypothetical protein